MGCSLLVRPFRHMWVWLVVLFAVSSYVQAQDTICPLHGTVPAECPHDYIWNTTTCQFQCKPHCVSNLGTFVPISGSYRSLCNSCTCNIPASICTLIRCDPSVCYDDQGGRYNPGQTITQTCHVGTCTLMNGTATWSWQDSVKPPAPNCAYANATWNSATCQWDCPSTCSDDSAATCLIQPCALASCNKGMICVDNYCPNYPIDGKARCTATCVTPVQCLIDPCQVATGQPSKCGTHEICEADYRFGCGFTCQPATCTYNNQTYHINETFAAMDGCNICTCMSDGQAQCTLRPCAYHNTTTPPPTCLKVCNEYCVMGKSCQPDENGCMACRNITATTSPPCLHVCNEDCVIGQSCQPDTNGCVSCRPILPITCTYDNMTYQVNDSRSVDDGCNECVCMESGEWICTLRPIPCNASNSTTSPPTWCPNVCVEACVIGSSCQPDENGCITCQPNPSIICTYQNITYQINDTRQDEDGCNVCTCMSTGDWGCIATPCPVPTTSTPTSTPTSSCPACTLPCIDGSQCVMNPPTCQPTCQPTVCSNSCFPVHCPSSTTCRVDSTCGTTCVSRSGMVMLTATFTMTWMKTSTTPSSIVTAMYAIASNAGILSVLVINASDMTHTGTKWTITIGIKGTSHDQQIQALNAFFAVLLSNGSNTQTSQYVIDQSDQISTTEQAMNTQTCPDGSSLSVDQTCPTISGVAGPTSSSSSPSPANSSSSSSSTSLITWVVPIVVGVVFFIVCGIAIVIIRDRRQNETIKTFDNAVQQQRQQRQQQLLQQHQQYQQQQQQPNMAPQAWNQPQQVSNAYEWNELAV